MAAKDSCFPASVSNMRSSIDIHLDETFLSLIKEAYIEKRLRFPPLLIRLLGLHTQATQLDILITFVYTFLFIIFVNSFNVCLFYFCIFSNKLNSLKKFVLFKNIF